MSKGIIGVKNSPRLPSGEPSRYLSLGQAIGSTISRFSDRIAITFKQRSMTYAELDSASDAMAIELQRIGIERQERIALLMYRSDKMIVSILAILKLGCTYLPIDPETPLERVKFILDDSSANAIIFGESINKDIYDFKIPSISAVSISADISIKGLAVPHETTSPGDVAYIIYTSGSSGNPKGVQVTHSNVQNYAYWFRSEFSMSEVDSIDFSSTLAFDFSVTSTIVPLLCGATITICPEEIKALPHLYLEYLSETNPSFIKITPSYFSQFKNLVQNSAIGLNRLTIVLGGEAAVANDIQEWFKIYPRHRIINEYGPTEATVATLAYSISDDDRYLVTSNIPIGLPAYNTQVYLLNGDEICVQGDIGELCIAGESVSKGYLGREELNAAVFIDNPFSDTGKLYRTGDLAKQLADGNIEFLGRIDHQIKINGHRIEPGEIETSLLKHHAIKTVVVEPFCANLETKLIAYLTLSSGSVASIFELRQYLKNRIPEYMIPSYFIFLEKMPLTINGKLDRAALPLPTEVGNRPESVGADNDTESSILKIWASILTGRFGVTDDFLVIGGDSLNAAQIIHGIEKQFSVNLSIKDFYAYSNIRKLAEYIDTKVVAAVEEDASLLEALSQIEAMSDLDIERKLKK